MEKFKKILYVALSIIAAIIAILSLLSVFRNTDSRYLKMLDFTRIQFFIAAGASLIIFWFLTKKWAWYDYLLIVALAGGMVVNGCYLINYTPLVAQAVPSSEKSTNTDNEIGILLINVKAANKTAKPLIDLLKDKKPDLVLAMEVDQWWHNELQAVADAYPYQQEKINKVEYGMTLYSKFPLKNTQINYLNNDKVPSFELTVELKSGKEICLYTVHPVPPTHFEHIPDNEGQKEMALVKIGQKIKAKSCPTIVAGDLNDVCWGYTDKLTETEGLLHDVRVGRGFYNSFSASNVLMRWPIDHVFVTKEFSVVALERLPDVSSDHFPIYVKLALEDN